jgi:hypothetical protein
MKKIIYNLRNQSEEVRRHILHTLTIVCGIILVLLWIYSLGTGLASPDTQAKISNDLKPLSALKANIVGGYKSISGPTDGESQ